MLRPAHAISLSAIVALGVAGGGCSTTEKAQERWSFTERFTPPQTPVFMNGPAALLLTNWETFSCHAIVAMGPGVTQEGELFGRRGRLLFAEEPNRNTTGKRLRDGGFSFLWDVREGKGFVLCDPLQGAAPLTGTRQFTNATAQALPGPPEKIEGILCQKQSVVITGTDGTASTFQVWRAREGGNFPIKLLSGEGAGASTITFSKVRFEAPPVEAFQPPEAFTKYATLDSLVNEYVARQQQLRGIRRTYSTDYGNGLGITPR